MNTEFAQTSFTIEITADGSPTLKLPNDGESMHHSGGAATETEYIYRSAIESCLKIWPEAEIAVVGLGIGYIEISWAQIALNLNLRKTKFVSFETEEILKENFLKWLSSDVASIYDQICFSLQFDSDVSAIKKLIAENILLNPLKGDLQTEFDQKNSYNLVCFDAYSKKTNVEIWTEGFLDNFFEKSCHENCVVTTYACTGELKRILKKHNFTLLDRRRFKSTRDSTLAVRGVFKSAAKTFRIS